MVFNFEYIKSSVTRTSVRMMIFIASIPIVFLSMDPAGVLFLYIDANRWLDRMYTSFLSMANEMGKRQGARREVAPE
jgi:hypothetical protein